MLYYYCYYFDAGRSVNIVARIIFFQIIFFKKCEIDGEQIVNTNFCLLSEFRIFSCKLINYRQKTNIRRRGNTCIESCENRKSWIRSFPCGKFQTQQKASDWTTYETTIVAVKGNSILMFLMSGWPSHISNQLDALKMILFITSIFVFLFFLSSLQNFLSEAQGMFWDRSTGKDCF